MSHADDTPRATGAPEPQAVARRYAHRADVTSRYSLLQPDVWQTVQERQRAMLRQWARLGWHDLSARAVIDVGCGAGGTLLELLRAGFAPEHLTGIELLPERLHAARRVLPPAVRLIEGDATAAPLGAECADMVCQSTVFSSLLDEAFQHRLAQAMWRWAKPGGGVLWYDFTVNNPRNADVRGIPVARLRALFPHGRLRVQRVTLAPPLARAVCRVHPALYGAFNALPPLRTHLLAWVEKSAS